MDIALLLANPAETAALLRNIKEANDLKAYVSRLQKEKEYRRRSLDLDIKVMRNRAQRSQERIRRCQTVINTYINTYRPSTNMYSPRQTGSPSLSFHGAERGAEHPKLMKNVSCQKEVGKSAIQRETICDEFNCDCFGEGISDEIINIRSQPLQKNERMGSPSGSKGIGFDSSFDKCMPINSFHTSFWRDQKGISEWRTNVPDSKRAAFKGNMLKEDRKSAGNGTHTEKKPENFVVSRAVPKRTQFEKISLNEFSQEKPKSGAGEMNFLEDDRRKMERPNHDETSMNNKNVFVKTSLKKCFSQPAGSFNVYHQTSVSRNSQREEEPTGTRKFGLSQSFNVNLFRQGDIQSSIRQKGKDAQSPHVIDRNLSVPASFNDEQTRTLIKRRSISVPVFNEPNPVEGYESLGYKPGVIARYICQKGPLITPKLESSRTNQADEHAEQTNITEEIRAACHQQTNFDVLKSKQIAKKSTAGNTGCFCVGSAFKDNLEGNAQQSFPNRSEKSVLDVAVHTKMRISGRHNTTTNGLYQKPRGTVIGSTRTACCLDRKTNAKQFKTEEKSQQDEKQNDVAEEEKSLNKMQIMVDDSHCVAQTVAKSSKQRKHSSLQNHQWREEPRRRSHIQVSKTMWAKVEIESAEQRKLQVEARKKNEARMLIASEYEKIKHCRYIRLPEHLTKEIEGSGMPSLVTIDENAISIN